MGKAKRTQLKRAEEMERAQRTADAKRAERRESMKITIAVVAVLLVVAIVAASCSLIVLSIRGTGNYLRNRIGIKSENIEVNNAMTSYFFYDTINSSITSMLSTYGLTYGIDSTTAIQYGLIPNPSQPLKTQTQTGTTTSWYDYFLSATKSNITSMLVLAEGAREAGIKLDETEYARIDRSIDGLTKAAEEDGTTPDKFLSENYGYGVKVSDVRDALELYYLSQKYYFLTRDAIEVTDSEIDTYYNAHTEDFEVVDYKAYMFRDTISNNALRDAARLALVTSLEEYDSVLYEILGSDYYDDDADREAAVKSALYENMSKPSGEVGEWLFSDERKVNDVKMFTDEANGTATVYILVNEAHIDESETRNVRHVLFGSGSYESDDEAKKAAEDALAEFIASGSSVEKFAELAAKHSTDSGSYESGGLYENVHKGQMVTEFDEWLFDENRKDGDVGIVKTSYGYHLMYYACEGLPKWRGDIKSALISEKYTDIAEELMEKYPVTVDDKKLSNIPDIK